MKITILGGGGFIGSAITDRLLKDNNELRIFDRLSAGPHRQFSADEKVSWLTGDFMAASDISHAISGADVVIHLVSTTLPKSSNDDPTYDVRSNLVATLQLLDAMVVRRVRKIVFVSSGGTVYGIPNYLPIDEGHPTEPNVSYGIIKLTIEKYLLMYQRLHGIKSNILRVANPFGERQSVTSGQGAIGTFLDRALRNQPLEIWGDGNAVRDYIYIDDVAEALARAVNYDGSKSIFNISSGVGTSLNEIASMVEQVVGHDVVRNYLPGRPFDVPISILDSSLAGTELNWQSQVGIKEGISRTAKWVIRSMVNG